MAGNTTNLYAGSAGHYPVGRMPYPPAIADALGLEGSERLLDVGCGPGSLTLVLAPRVRAAVGVDADAGMLAEAARQALRAGATNVTWKRMRAAGFTGPERIEVDAGGVVTRGADEIVASVFSLSYAAPERFGAALPRFEADLRALLAATSPAGAFSERRREIALDVWR